jgi:predicted MFS family arabinose efflux permease
MLEYARVGAGLGTAVSTTLAGLVSDSFGRPAALWVLAIFGVLAFGAVAFAMPETGEPVRSATAHAENRLARLSAERAKSS